LFVISVVLLLIVMFYVLFMCKCVLPPGVNPIAVDKYISINLGLHNKPKAAVDPGHKRTGPKEEEEKKKRKGAKRRRLGMLGTSRQYD
jgi:hypothetical protein